MSSVQLKDLKGKNVGEVNLADAVFGIEPNVHVMHTAFVRQMANGRAGTASTKTRSEVRGGGKKPWRQKGTGRARAGSIRSPLWNGGGVTFGPRPRDYSKSLPKKARQLALKSALAAKKDALVVVKDFGGLLKDGAPKTKHFAGMLKDLSLTEAKVLFVVEVTQLGAKELARSARNIPSVIVCDVNDLNVKALVEADAVLLSEHAVETINNRFCVTCPDAKAATEKRSAVHKARLATSANKAPAAKVAGPTEAEKAEARARRQAEKQAKADARAAEKAAKKAAEGDAPAKKQDKPKAAAPKPAAGKSDKKPGKK